MASGVNGLMEPYVVSDSDDGDVIVAVIGSPCGNVIHTLVNTDQVSNNVSFK